MRRFLAFLLVPALVVVLAACGDDDDKKGSSTSTTSTTTPSSGDTPESTAKALYAAWQSGDKAAAAEVATENAVTEIFAIPAAQGSGLEFGGCDPATGASFCSWTRPGGQLVMTVNDGIGGGAVQVTEVRYGAAGTPPTAPPTPRPAPNPEAAAKALYLAWQQDNRDEARQVATAEAVSELFTSAYEWLQTTDGPVDPYAFSGCQGAAGSVQCTWSGEDNATITMSVNDGTGGGEIQVVQVQRSGG